MRAAGDRDLKVYGIFGYPLSHTVSPAIQNCAFEFHRLKAVYFAFERPPARFRFLMRNIKSLVLDGFNVTIPFKEAIIPYLDQLSREAKLVGAVNTVKKQNGRWIGYNTDIEGFLAGLKQAGFKPRGKSAVVLGARGSARAVVFALAQNGARKISVVNRTKSRAQNLIRKFRRSFPNIQWVACDFKANEWKHALSQADLLVNATKVGLKKNDPSLVLKKLFPKRKILVYDLIYQPRQTALLRSAAGSGHKIVNGETMLLYQGAKAFEIWTGKRAPVSKMKKALRDALCAQ
ncbi:MAG: shikimate dehydrogenase [Omnitrophica bacterium RIFCSPHIGHO2_02_FULL_46_11]|nr:MAG: shikimate dehydrogenase [Omnitrophica bacterium RIFCSPHIGHO2_02_FULL_46_11]OGW87629.1 MAG: shikimate dehydrogenase [Omnitrophica bacterium RIFCSPLOWO2_01_FULL_45_10b]